MIQICGAQGGNSDSDSRGSGAIQIQMFGAQEEK
jgi:hypothetical protein